MRTAGNAVAALRTGREAAVWTMRMPSFADVFSLAPFHPLERTSEVLFFAVVPDNEAKWL
jgi:hypothetical protein